MLVRNNNKVTPTLKMSVKQSHNETVTTARHTILFWTGR